MFRTLLILLQWHSCSERGRQKPTVILHIVADTFRVFKGATTTLRLLTFQLARRLRHFTSTPKDCIAMSCYLCQIIELPTALGALAPKGHDLTLFLCHIVISFETTFFAATNLSKPQANWHSHVALSFDLHRLHGSINASRTLLFRALDRHAALCGGGL